MRSPERTLIAFRLLLVVVGLAVLNSAANGADLTVSVSRVGINKASQPIANAQVCVASSSGVLSQNTNSQGTVVFSNAPQGQLTVTASASGFVGQSIQFTMGSTNKTESLILQTGSGGPQCNAQPPPPAVTIASLSLDHTAVNDTLSSRGTVTLTAPAPAGGFIVNLSSSNTSVATVPPSINVPANTLTQIFDVSTRVVSATTVVTITANGGGTSKTINLTVIPQPTEPPPPPANLTVLVSTTSRPISGASVCVRASTGALQSALTNLAGNAVFQGVATGEVTITVSSSGFTGQSHTSTLPAAGGTARFILSPGSGGPACAAASPPRSGPATLSISSFDWHVNRRTPLFFEIALAFVVTRNPGGLVVPSHYRVGETSDLSAAQWIPFQGGVPTFQMRYRGDSLTAFGQRTLFLQVKQGDLVSNVASKAVNLRSLQTSEFRLEGTELQSMVNVARQAGFSIRTRTVSVTQSTCGATAFDANTLHFVIATGNLPDREWVKVVEANLLELSTRHFTPGWRVKNILIDQSPDTDARQQITGVADGDGFRTTITLSEPAARGSAKPAFCLNNSFRLRAIVLEGPADDLALDPTRRWKNMFPSH